MTEYTPPPPMEEGDERAVPAVGELTHSTLEPDTEETPEGTPVESPHEPAPEGWKRDDDGGITAVDVPWKGYV